MKFKQFLVIFGKNIGILKKKLFATYLELHLIVLIYGFTDLFLFPFRGLTSSPAIGNMVLEISSMFAMLVYALVAWAVERLVWLIFYRPR